jgi:3-oxoacyl-[acyl-carrier protein] reductase
VCARLSADGFSIVAVDINGDTAAETAALLGGEARTCDVGDRESVGALSESLPAGIDVLINNAGIWRFHSLVGSRAGDIDDVLRVNLLGTINCTLAFAGKMAARGGGSVVNFTSAAAAMRAQGVGIYPVSKAAVEALTQQLAVELGPSGVRVNAVGPGMIVTDGTRANYAGERGAQRAKTVPLRRVGEPGDIADVVAFLASDASRYVSGQIIYVDGGIVAGRS